MASRGYLVGVLLLTYLGASRPPPTPEATYLGLTATLYHLVGLYGGLVLMLGGAFGPDRRFQRSRPADRAEAPGIP